MKIRIFLALMALMYIAFGLWAFIDPIGMTGRMDVDVSGANGAYEMRGLYGGVSFGAGLLCAVGALRAAMVRPALWFITAYMGGYVIARVAALAMGPPPTATFASFISFEVITLIIAIIALRANRGT